MVVALRVESLLKILFLVYMIQLVLVMNSFRIDLVFRKHYYIRTHTYSVPCSHWIRMSELIVIYMYHYWFYLHLHTTHIRVHLLNTAQGLNISYQFVVRCRMEFVAKGIRGCLSLENQVKMHFCED